MTQGDVSPNSTTASTVFNTSLLSTTAAPGTDDRKMVNPGGRPSLTDTLAAVTIAVLAVILVITLTLIIRAVRLRRRRERGQELNHIPTISAGIMSANMGAYRGQRTRRAEQGVISWEPVTPPSSRADLVASTSVSGVPSSC